MLVPIGGRGSRGTQDSRMQRGHQGGRQDIREDPEEIQTQRFEKANRLTRLSIRQNPLVTYTNSMHIIAQHIGVGVAGKTRWHFLF